MTHQEFDKRVDEILDRIVSQEAITEGGYAEYTTDAEAIKYGNPLHNKHELRQAIRELFLEVVGDDESWDVGMIDVAGVEVENRNQLRHKLRTTITGKEGGE